MEVAPVPRPRRRGALIGLVLTLIAALTAATPQPALAADPLVSQGKAATASSTENGTFPASAAVDGNTASRWSSAFSDPQWIQIDLGASYAISQVVLNWEAAYATGYQIQTSADGSAWTTIASTTTGTGGIQTLAVSGTGRYVRMNGTARATPYGYSLWEFQVFGTTTGGPGIPGGGSLGPNVLVFDPSMSTASIQSQLNTVFSQSETQQFGGQRYELLFKPGTYNDLTANIGFYTSIAGLGRNPTDVNLNSSNVTVDAGWFGGNATQNFWRSTENFSVTPPAGTAYERWAVAQAAPMRRMNINTHLSLTPTGFGWASGGYIADTKVNGQLQPFSQQQWYTRNSNIQMNLNAVWNNVFTGVVGAPATSFPNPPITTLATTPISREKPYLYLDGSNYAVWVPSLQTNSSNVTWPNTPGSSIPLTQFYVAHPGDSAATINAALAQGLNLLFTPGIYHVNQTINVNRANTVVMGLGYATIVPDGGVTPMTVADVDGVKISSLLFDAGTTNSANLLQIGPAGSSAGHAGNPTSVQDVFFRIGGAGPGAATNSLLVNSNNTLLDHIWAWRADHGAGVGWTTNPAASGLIVNGNNVLALGLFVEHYQNYQVQWNGNGGRTIFFQNEMPYDPPTQAAWRTGTNGYAAYKVANSVTTHEAWGMGSYCYFNVNPSIVAARGFEAPNASGVRFHSLLTVSLGGVGSITNVINTTGAVAQGTDTVPSYLVAYP
ncbi:discoidin domain-containing protein [Actinoplanes sp. NPDC026623]|uniref:discoidin domain-containing protein n=1 Tax=Actinoplanes sp. NPDC026623 TaxID=3155610 RepID=UPI0033E60DF9